MEQRLLSTRCILFPSKLVLVHVEVPQYVNLIDQQSVKRVSLLINPSFTLAASDFSVLGAKRSNPFTIHEGVVFETLGAEVNRAAPALAEGFHLKQFGGQCQIRIWGP